MPRYGEYLLRFLANRVNLVILIILGSLGWYIYHRPSPEASHAVEGETFKVSGVSPSQDAGLLGGIGVQHKALRRAENEIAELRNEIRLLRKPAKPGNVHSKQVAALQQQLTALQAHIQESGQRAAAAQSAAQPAARPAPEVKLRSSRDGLSEALLKKGRKKRSGIQIAQEDPRDSSLPAPYLPPESYGLGVVKHGYTGLASLETFPVTLEATTVFSAANGHSVPVTGCRFAATATPKELVARGELRLTRMTCINALGKTIERPISGYVTAADNMNGQIADVFWHEREVVAAFGKAAIPAALASLFREVRRTIDVASLTGVVVSTSNTVSQEVAGRMADLYLDKAEQLASPIIWVPPQRQVHIYINEGARLDGLFDLPTVIQREPLARRMAR